MLSLAHHVGLPSWGSSHTGEGSDCSVWGLCELAPTLVLRYLIQQMGSMITELSL